jgi:hypothetical protein
MFVCCECCVLSGRGLCDGLITRPEESYRLWRVIVCDQETSNSRRLKPATGLWKIQPQWVVTPGKQTNKQTNKHDGDESDVLTAAVLFTDFSKNHALFVIGTFHFSAVIMAAAESSETSVVCLYQSTPRHIPRSRCRRSHRHEILKSLKNFWRNWWYMQTTIFCCFNYAVSFQDYVAPILDWWIWPRSISGMILTGEDISTRRRTFHSATLFTTNPSWPFWYRNWSTAPRGRLGSLEA